MENELQDLYEKCCATPSDINAHLPTLYQAVIDTQAKIVVELGIFHGNSASALLYGVSQTGGHLYSVDIVDYDGYLHSVWRHHPQWTRFVSDSTIDVGIPFPIDVLFIDSRHSYKHTIAELNLYGSRVRTGGYILCHDTELDVSGAFGDDSIHFGVKTALDEWCPAHGQTWSNTPGSFGLGTVIIKASE